jgi:Ni/Fe-hydrogenase 1 B-type cytochrome subunit
MSTKAAVAGNPVIDKATPRPESRDMVRYYVWDVMVRISHWLNFPLIVGLILTGFYIGGPNFRPNVDEPYGSYTMATMKNLHFLLAILFTTNGLFRIYWFWGGKTWRQWYRNQIWEKDFWKEVWWKLKEYVLLRYTKREAATLTHNALAALAYTLLFLACGFITITGFAMRGMINPGGWLDMLFGWVIPLLGGEAPTRMLHRLAMWVIIAFSVHHIAFVFYFEVLAERGLISSMITGYKTKPARWKQQDKPWEEK